MNVFELFGTIAINNTEANKAITATGERASKLSKGMKSSFDKIGNYATRCGRVIVGALSAAAITSFGKNVLNLVGELEQNMGGSEAVFGKYAEGIQKKASEAFKNMGLSQAEYLATANKMGALFQGVGYDVDESAQLTAEAMQRAADVASIMGIDTAWAMESIAGAAKGNFSMLDNLGVAINDTTLANYALEKGIKKSTSKMSTQEKVMLAMQMFMEETAYATGNYAKENDTLAGSISTAKAAFTNFLAGSGTVDDFVESFENATRVVLRNLGEIVPRLGKSIWQAGKKMLPKLTATMRDAWNNKLPVIATNGANKIIDAANAVFGTNIPHVDNINFPTWEEMTTSVTTWWAGIKTSLQNACQWTLKLFESPNEAATEAGAAIEKWWKTEALPGIKEVSQWTLGLFGTPIEDGATVKDHVSAWWKTAKGWVESACDWTLALFDVPENYEGDFVGTFTFIVQKCSEILSGLTTAVADCLEISESDLSTLEAIAGLAAIAKCHYGIGAVLLGGSVYTEFLAEKKQMEENAAALPEASGGLWEEFAPYLQGSYGEGLDAWEAYKNFSATDDWQYLADFLEKVKKESEGQQTGQQTDMFGNPLPDGWTVTTTTPDDSSSELQTTIQNWTNTFDMDAFASKMAEAIVAGMGNVTITTGNVTLNDGALVGRITPQINVALGRMAGRGVRSVMV